MQIMPFAYIGTLSSIIKLQVFDGGNSTRMCGNGDIEWTSETADVKIKFNSDESKAGHGFVINFNFV